MSVLFVSVSLTSYKPLKFEFISYKAVFLCEVYYTLVKNLQVVGWIYERFY